MWDLPTRVFHAALGACVAAAIASAEAGGDWMPWHLRCGEAVLALLAFRIAWGVVGGRWSRFAAFAPTPARVMRALGGRATADDEAGHSPRGSLSIWLFLALLSLQVATGLVADDDIGTTGPLNAHVSGRLAKRASAWHAGWGANLLFALIALHVAAVAWYTWRRRLPLLRAMWTGDKPLPPATPASVDSASRRWLALGLFGVAVAAVLAMLRWAA